MSRRSQFAAALASVAVQIGCGSVFKELPADKDVVSSVDIEGARVVDPDDVLDGLATAPSSRFLGLFDGVLFEYEVFDEDVLARDLLRIERLYRARGHYEASVTAARVIHDPDDPRKVAVVIRVFEGPPVRIRRLHVAGIAKLPFDVSAAAFTARTLDENDVFDEIELEATKEAIRRALTDRGYAFAKVTAKARVDIARHEAEIDVTVVPGPLAVYGDVRFIGLKEIPEAPVRANLGLVKGEPYSEADVEDARSALNALGVFARVDIHQELGNPDSRRVPIRVIVQESALRTLRLGGGSEIDQVRFSTHLRAGWISKNFLGGMRRFTIETRPGLVFFPTRIPSGESSFQLPTDFLPENRVRAELKQPSFLEGRTTGFLSSEFNIYAVLFQEEPQKDESVLGFREFKSSLGVERAFFGQHLFVTPSYNWQASFPFAYLNELNEGLRRVIVSYPELVFNLDFRDDTVRPHAGVFFSNSVQVAGYAFGGDASDVKVRPELRTYVPISRKVTLATRTTVGLLFPDPDSYGSTLAATTSLIDATNPAIVRDQQLLLFRAFYSGGPNSNRGYGVRGVGPHGPLGLLAPGELRCRPEDTSPECIRPLGGLTLWEASVEVRFPIVGPLDGATFLDASDVTRRVAEIRFDFPHVAAGLGVRYATPIGPFRIDVGYRIPQLQQVGQDELRPSEGNPGEILGQPLAFHFAIGEAF